MTSNGDTYEYKVSALTHMTSLPTLTRWQHSTTQAVSGGQSDKHGGSDDEGGGGGHDGGGGAGQDVLGGVWGPGCDRGEVASSNMWLVR